jgi:DNA polymerase III delta prime subunit
MLYQKQWQFLQKMAELGKTPHALLFYGFDASGLKELALRFVALLNRQNVGKGIQPDLFLIGPGDEREIKIGQIRELRTKLSLKSYSAPFKSVIIEGAHFLNQEAQSAFLKMLEEPKGKTIFILITEYPEMLLPTILSRVERLRFYSPLKSYQKEEIEELLKLHRADLAQRFSYVKKLAETPQALSETLGTWLKYFRELLIASAHGQAQGYSLFRLRKIIKTLQTTDFLISTTNVNPRLALEILMLEL